MMLKTGVSVEVCSFEAVDFPFFYIANSSVCHFYLNKCSNNQNYSGDTVDNDQNFIIFLQPVHQHL